MKIITLHQPYASLIALGLKHYETRSWATNYRGKLAIHAAKQPFVSEYGNALIQEYDRAWLDALKLAHDAGILNDRSRLPFAHQLPLGAIVAVVDLVDCLTMSDAWAAPGHINNFEKGAWHVLINAQTELERAVGDWRVGRRAWKLDNILALPEPIPYKGGQGLRFLEEDVASLIDAQLGVTA